MLCPAGVPQLSSVSPPSLWPCLSSHLILPSPSCYPSRQLPDWALGESPRGPRMPLELSHLLLLPTLLSPPAPGPLSGCSSSPVILPSPDFPLLSIQRPLLGTITGRGGSHTPGPSHGLLRCPHPNLWPVSTLWGGSLGSSQSSWSSKTQCPPPPDPSTPSPCSKLCPQGFSLGPFLPLPFAFYSGSFLSLSLKCGTSWGS